LGIFVGENVTELFRRIAAVTFEQAILRELEIHGNRTGGPQIGSGGVLSKCFYSESEWECPLCFPFQCVVFVYV